MDGMYVIVTSVLAPYYGWFFATAGVYELGRFKAEKEASILRFMLGIALAASGVYLISGS